MQPVPCTGWRSLFKLDAYRFKFLKPSFSSKILDILDERVPRCQMRYLVTLLVVIIPSMPKEGMEMEVFLSAKVARAGTQAVMLIRIE